MLRGSSTITRSRVVRRRADTMMPSGIPQRISPFDKTLGTSTNFGGLKLNSVGQVEIYDFTTDLILSNNPLSSLDGCPQLESLQTLDLVNTNIATLRGFPPLPNLTSINVQGTPFSKNVTYRTALLILYPTLKFIDGSLVRNSERNYAENYGPKVATLVRNGWIPSIKPPNNREADELLISLIASQRVFRARTTSPETRAQTLRPGQFHTMRERVFFKNPSRQVNLSDRFDQIIQEQEEEIKRLEIVLA